MLHRNVIKTSFEVFFLLVKKTKYIKKKKHLKTTDEETTMIDVYVKQANEAYFFSILAYLDFNLFIKEENGKEVPVIQSLNDFIDKRNRYNSKNKIKDRFL